MDLSGTHLRTEELEQVDGITTSHRQLEDFTPSKPPVVCLISYFFLIIILFGNCANVDVLFVVWAWGL